jgi:hypothetical protein
MTNACSLGSKAMKALENLEGESAIGHFELMVVFVSRTDTRLILMGLPQAEP